MRLGLWLMCRHSISDLKWVLLNAAQKKIIQKSGFCVCSACHRRNRDDKKQLHFGSEAFVFSWTQIFNAMWTTIEKDQIKTHPLKLYLSINMHVSTTNL